MVVTNTGTLEAKRCMMLNNTVSQRYSLLPTIYSDTKGAALIGSLMVMAVLSLLGTLAIMTSSIESQISGNTRAATEVFYIADAGVEDGREGLRVLDAASANRRVFDDELGTVVGANGVLDGYANGTTDDTPLVNRTLGDGSYTVYLSNDTVDGSTNLVDTNDRVILTAVSTAPGGAQAMIEVVVSAASPLGFPIPAPITLLGSGASFAAGNSNAKELHGDDQCGSEPSKPVIAVSDSADVAGVQSAILSSKPDTYSSTDGSGNTVTANDDIDTIGTDIPASTMTDIANDFGIDMLDPVSLNSLVTTAEAHAHTVSTNGSVANLGDSSNPQIVVVKGDFDLNGDGAGILVVTGDLTFQGNVSYEGLILVIGNGYMKRNGGGNGVIGGGIIVANTRGPDNILGTADDDTALGAPTFDTSGGGNSSIEYCSTALNNVQSQLPLSVVAYRHIL